MKTAHHTLAAIALAAIALTACDDDKMYDLNHAESPFINEITFNYNDALILPVGEKLDLQVNVSPSTLSVNDLKFTSSNPAVAAIDGGVLNCLAPGDATVMALPTVGFGPQASLKVTVVQNVNYTAAVTVKPAEELDEFIIEGDRIQFAVTNTAEDPTQNPTYRYFTWTTSNPEVAAVDQNGLLECLKPGTVTVTATTRKPDKEGIAGTYTIDILQGVEIEDLDIAPLKDVYYFEENPQLEVTYTPAHGDKKQVIWTSSNPAVATVDNGKITTLGFGTTEISATLINGIAKSVTLYIVPGWHVWDTTDDFTGWNIATAGATIDRTNPDYITVNMVENNGRLRGDIKYAATANKPLVMDFSQNPVFALRVDIPANGRNTFDFVDITGKEGGSPQCNLGQYTGAAQPYELSDGSYVIYVDWSARSQYKTAPTMLKTCQIKVADIPADQTTRRSYRIYWIRTFESLEQMKQFADSQAAN